MLNVKYVIARDETPLPTIDGRDKFELALDTSGELSVYRNLTAMPRAWVVGEAALSSDVAAANAALQRSDFDPQQEVVLLAAEDPPPAEGANGEATIVHYGSSEMTINVSASAAGYLVLSEVWYPGWRAKVNDQGTNVYRANGALRAVSIPAGESTVRLWFAPMTWRWGVGAFLVGVIATVILLAFRRWTTDDR
jgi:hypothetical protein